ncbi:TBC1 domain family member 8B-like isoform X1 [Zingiber officinale]|uniref:TBC1 domain family member 8B-like isoform X1 n=2 Tax=Zingiber officinale TaxID=94328 RepID=UPI001C4C2EFA|nr:TBC1 domain family member 8B-like isoform X1 [Zingiber officinale]
MKGKSLPIITFEHKRDAYGFAVRPQHLQRYREYANIYKEEEEERSERWNDLLKRLSGSGMALTDGLSAGKRSIREHLEAAIVSGMDNVLNETSDCNAIDEVLSTKQTSEEERKIHCAQTWARIRPSLSAIEQMMSHRVKRKNSDGGDQAAPKSRPNLASIEESKVSEESEDEFYDVERSDPVQEVSSGDDGNVDSSTSISSQGVPEETKEELECLVRGGLPMALRGELWQAFVGVGARRVEGYYNSLLDVETNTDGKEVGFMLKDENGNKKRISQGDEKWKGQIEKDLPRTFPGHPALDENGRNALRRLLTAYARHNPSVGYCQAMNFFAGLLLLLMPEENAFWTLLGIIDDYFDGYYSEEMIESQVDQLVFEDLVRERFPKLVNHLDYLGVQVAWVTGPWFLSIFVNMLPWESVLRAWDVLLFEGSREMLFRTALALMELYGPAIVTTKDAGDAVTLLQSLAGSTFDSSQLVLTACMGYQPVNEIKLQELRNKHRPSVIAAMEERSKGLRVWKDSKGLATKLYSFKRDNGPLVSEAKAKENVGEANNNGDIQSTESDLTDCEDVLSTLTVDAELDSLPDLQEQATWLRVELCRLLEEKRSATLRAEELETALMEMVKQDNRRLLSAKVEQLENEIAELQQALAEKQEQERAMLEILMRVEQEQKVTEDARLFAEQEAAAQRHSAHALQEKYEEAMSLLAQMENRAVMAETMLEATLQYQSSQLKALKSPKTPSSDKSSVPSSLDSSQEIPPRKISLLSRPFVLGWRDKNKSKQNAPEESVDGEQNVENRKSDTNGHQEQEK